MPNKHRESGFSHEEIVREHDEETGVDHTQDKRTLPIHDGPTDHGRQIPDSAPEADPYAPPAEDLEP